MHLLAFPISVSLLGSYVLINPLPLSNHPGLLLNPLQGKKKEIKMLAFPPFTQRFILLKILITSVTRRLPLFSVYICVKLLSGREFWVHIHQPCILKNVLSLVLQVFLYFAEFDCNTCDCLN